MVYAAQQRHLIVRQSIQALHREKGVLRRSSQSHPGDQMEHAYRFVLMSMYHDRPGCSRQRDQNQTASAPLKTRTKRMIMPQWRTTVSRLPLIEANTSNMA